MSISSSSFKDQNYWSKAAATSSSSKAVLKWPYWRWICLSYWVKIECPQYGLWVRLHSPGWGYVVVRDASGNWNYVSGSWGWSWTPRWVFISGSYLKCGWNQIRIYFRAYWPYYNVAFWRPFPWCKWRCLLSQWRWWNSRYCRCSCRRCPLDYQAVSYPTCCRKKLFI